MAFLLDCCPPDYRQYAVLRRHPVVLARFAAECVDAQVRRVRRGAGGVPRQPGRTRSAGGDRGGHGGLAEQEAALRRTGGRSPSWRRRCAAGCSSASSDIGRPDGDQRPWRDGTGRVPH